jgi:DNA polymerase-3 subunit epsilon
MSESKRIIVVDTETTGLDPERDELLQVSIIDNNGKKLFDSLFKPKAASWEAAMKVNHITPEMVQDAPRIAEKIVEITEIMYQADEIIGYNTKFDIDFLENNGLVLRGNVKIIDVMAMFKETHEIKKWVKLTEAAAFYGFEWGEAQAHNSLGDCRATLFVYDHLTCDDTRIMGIVKQLDPEKCIETIDKVMTEGAMTKFDYDRLFEIRQLMEAFTKFRKVIPKEE